MACWTNTSLVCLFFATYGTCPAPFAAGATTQSGNSSGAPFVPGWCTAEFDRDAKTMAARMHDVRGGICGTSIAAKREGVPCHKFGIVSPQGFLCRALGQPISVADWTQADRYRDTACELPHLSEYMKCSYACPGHSSAVCDTTPNVLVTWFYTFLFDLVNPPDTKNIDKAEVESRIMLEALGNALYNNMWNLMAQVFAAGVFIKPLPGWVRVLSVLASIVLYAVAQAWVQVAGTLMVALSYTSGAAVNANNVYLAFGSVVMCCAVIAVDAVGQVWFSFGVTAMLLILLLGLAVGIVSKRLTIDVGTLTHFIVGMLNIVTQYRIIIVARKSDPAIALIVYALDCSVPWGLLFTPFYQSRIDEARNLALIIVKAAGLDSSWMLTIWVVAFTVAYGLFMFLRATLGFQVMRRVKGLSTGRALWDGFLLVWTDVSAPFELIGELLHGRSAKHLSFVGCSALLKLLELAFAPELALLSGLVAIGMSAFDYRITKVAKTLCDNTLSGGFAMDLASFPVIGSIPFLDTETVTSVRKAAARLYLTADNVSVKGVGLLVKRGAELYVYTVDHVVAGMKSLRFSEDGPSLSVASARSESYGTSKDPVTVLRFSGADAWAAVKEAGLSALDDIGLLGLNETTLAKAMLFVSPEGCFNYLGPSLFSLSKQGLEMKVDLKHGDSGSPLFAVFADGRMKFAGAVSRARGNGETNVASCVADTYASYSPGVSADSNTVVFDGGYADSKDGMIKQAQIIQDATKAVAGKPDMPKRAKNKKKQAARQALAVLRDFNTVSEEHAKIVATAIDEERAVKFNWQRNRICWQYGYEAAEAVGAGASESGEE